MYLQNTVIEASIQLPPSLFSPKQKREVRLTEDSLYKLQLIAFRNGKLFPATGNSTNLADDGKRRTVVTPVILTKLGSYAAYVLLTRRTGVVYGSRCLKTLIFVLSHFNESPVKKDLAEYPLVCKLTFNSLRNLFQKH